MKAIWTAFVPCLLAVTPAAAREIVVSPRGLTPHKALLAARAARAAHPNETVVVRVRRGTYPIDAPLVFTAADSGVVWKGEDRAVICGGGPIAGWTQDAPGVVSAPAPKAAEGKIVYFEQLWVTGRRAPHSV